MSTVGTLNINFASNVAQLISDMGKASRAVQSSSKKMEQSLAGATKGVEQLIGAWLSFEGVRRINGLAMASIKMADDIGEAAQRVGIATDKFQGYSTAAASAGFVQDEWNKTLDVFNKNIGLAINGQGKAKDALQAMGIDLEAVKNGQIDAGDVLLSVADKLDQFGSKAAEAAVLTKLFGAEAGPKMAAMMAGGKEGILRMMEASRSLGLIMDQSLIDKAMQAGDSMDLLSRVITTNFKAGMLSGFIDEFNRASDLMTDPAIAASVRDIGSGVGGLVGNFLDVSSSAILAARGVLAFEDATSGLQKMAVIVGKGMAAAWHSLEVGVYTVGGTISSMVEMALINIKDLITALNKIPKVQIDVAGMDGAIGSAGKLKNAYAASLKDSANRLGTNLDLNYVNTDLQTQKTALDGLLKTTNEFTGAQRQGAAGMLEFGDAASKANEVFEDFGYTLLTTKNKTDDFYNNLIDRSIDAGFSIESWRDTAVSALKDFAKELLHVGNAGQSSGSIGGFLAQQVMGFFSGGLYSMSDSGVPIPGHKPAVPTRDVGGAVSGGKPYKVGVPELFIPRSSGTAVPLENMGGSTYHIDARGADSAGIARLEAMIRELNGSIEPRALSAVQDFSKRSSSFLR